MYVANRGRAEGVGWAEGGKSLVQKAGEGPKCCLDQRQGHNLLGWAQKGGPTTPKVARTHQDGRGRLRAMANSFPTACSEA